MHRRQVFRLMTAAGVSQLVSKNRVVSQDVTQPVFQNQLVSQYAAHHVSHPVSHSQPIFQDVSQPVLQKRSLLDAPLPKFQAFDCVFHDYTVDDDLDTKDHGKTFRLIGVIIGMTFNSESCYKRGWLYYVTTYKPKSLAQVWNVDSYLHESEITALHSPTPVFGEFELDTSSRAIATIQRT
jgi:hypothetical protein